MVTKPTGRPRGRPKIPLIDDTDRSAVALTLATMKLLPPSQRSLRCAAKIIAAFEIGNEIEAPSIAVK
jgi:hypothetical protein